MVFAGVKRTKIHKVLAGAKRTKLWHQRRGVISNVVQSWSTQPYWVLSRLKYDICEGYVGCCINVLLCEYIVQRKTHIVIIQDFDMDKLINDIFVEEWGGFIFMGGQVWWSRFSQHLSSHQGPGGLVADQDAQSPIYVLQCQSNPWNIAQGREAEIFFNRRTCDLYLGILQCPTCSTSLSGIWRSQLNILVTQAMDLMFRSGELDELLVFDSHISREYQQDKWLPRVKEDFKNFSGNICSHQLTYQRWADQKDTWHWFSRGQKILQTYYRSCLKVKWTPKHTFEWQLWNSM